MLKTTGRVVAVHGNMIRVAWKDRILLATARRNLNWEGETSKGMRLVVGDIVLMGIQPSGEAVILSVSRRKNALLRQAPGGKGKRAQALAANIDLALLVFAARDPRPRQGLLDRFLTGCFLSDIDPVIVFNKIDQGTDIIADMIPVYRDLGYPLLEVSARTRRGMGPFKRILHEKTVLFCGPSGAGKSSLLNAISPGLKLKTGTVSESTGKGRHTTTRAELIPLAEKTFVIDTPGLREFGLWQLDRVRLQQAFPEIDGPARDCRYSNCSHSHEPSCAVRAALKNHLINPGRYRSYVRLLEELEE